MIRLLTAADVPAIERIVKDARGETFDPAQFWQSPNPFIIVGDPAVPALCRLEHYQLETGPNRVADLAHLPPALAVLVAASDGWSTQVTDLYPLPYREPGGPALILATMLPLLATALRELPLQVSPAERVAVLNRPVWARLDPGLILLMHQAFPLAGTDAYRVIWRGRLRSARDDVAQLAVML